MSERHRRSLVKGISWRIIGTSGTVLLAWLFTRQWGMAVKIGGFEFITKIALYYLHERMWEHLSFGKSSGSSELRRRSIARGVTWRMIGTLDTILIAFFISGSTAKASGIGIAETFAKAFLFYFHERAWNRIPLGRYPDHLRPSDPLQQ